MPEMPDELISYEQIIDKFEAMTKDAESVQRETLKAILERNSGTEYLQKWNLNGRFDDPQHFKSCVPLVTYADMALYIQRIADGDTSPVLTTDRISVISLSSGTTNGKRKVVPFNDKLLADTFQIYYISGAYRARLFPIKPGGRVLEFVYGSKESSTKGGLVASTATTNIYRSESFKIYKKNIQILGCSPDEVIFGFDSRQSMYCHILCGLLYSNEVQFMSSTFSYSIVEAFRTFEQDWQQLCNDIKEGKLNEKITVPSMRASVSKLLKPDPDLADAIYNKCKNIGNWHGVIPLLWPNAKYIISIMTGAMEPYLRKLRHYAGDLPLLTSEYGATEGWIAANIDPTSSPENTIYTVVPDIGYFEFIPLHLRHEGLKLDNSVATADYIESEPVGLTEVKVGQEYEVVLTTFAGLYRYRLGDVVKVTGFYNSSPQLSYICRKNLILTVNIDKTTEKDLQISVDKATELLKEENVDLVDFTSYADLSTVPGHYVIFWELSDSLNEGIVKRCCSIMDETFIDPGYVVSRKANTIGPLELRIVERGTFRKIIDYYTSHGGAVNQFKTPRCISTNQALLDILNKNTIQTCFSTLFS
jgi:jasmonic acid-amino synthetase